MQQTYTLSNICDEDLISWKSYILLHGTDSICYRYERFFSQDVKVFRNIVLIPLLPTHKNVSTSID